MSREIMQQALDALEMHVLGFDGVRKMELAIEALEAELAKPDETETLKKCLFQMQNAAIELAKPEQAPKLTDAGADTNITRGLEPKGSGMVTLNQVGMRVDLKDAPPRKPWQEPVGQFVGGIPEVSQQREWVGLTGTEINHIFAANIGYPERMCRAIEAKLKEKNEH
jgi:hypothetical protein